MNDTLHKFHSLRVKNLFNYIHEFQLTGKEVPLHDLRVEMKKYKSLIKFLSFVYRKQKFKKMSLKLKYVFQHSGEIREYQLLQTWLHKHQLKNITSLYFPETELKEMTESFRFQIAQYKKTFEEAVSICTPYIEDTNMILCEQYVTVLRSKLEKLFLKKIHRSDWHELRKLIKQWMYATNWMPDSAEYNSGYSQFNKLQEMIGGWHDLEMIKETLSVKQIYLSIDVTVQKEFAHAWEKLNHAIRIREKQIKETLETIQSGVESSH